MVYELGHGLVEATKNIFMQKMKTVQKILSWLQETWRSGKIR